MFYSREVSSGLLKSLIRPWAVLGSLGFSGVLLACGLRFLVRARAGLLGSQSHAVGPLKLPPPFVPSLMLAGVVTCRVNSKISSVRKLILGWALKGFDVRNRRSVYCGLGPGRGPWG